MKNDKKDDDWFVVKLVIITIVMTFAIWLFEFPILVRDFRTIKEYWGW